jgi:hemin uptake protein HemP
MVLFVVWAVRQVSSVKLFGGDGLLLSVWLI